MSARKPVRVLEPGEVSALLRTFGRSPTGVRNRALAVVLWRAGLRVGEALALDPSHLDRASGTVTVHRGKSGPRVVAMDPLAFDAVDAWLAERRRLGIARGAPLFCTVGGKRFEAGRPMPENYPRQMLKRHALRAGLEPDRVHPHALRHAFAVELARAGAPMPVVQRLLGHSSLAVTDAYLRRIDQADVLDWQRRRSWGGAREEAAR